MNDNVYDRRQTNTNTKIPFLLEISSLTITQVGFTYFEKSSELKRWKVLGTGATFSSTVVRNITSIKCTLFYQLLLTIVRYSLTTKINKRARI